MLYLLFELGQNRFAIEARRVVEVLPLLQINKILHSPGGVAGFFNHRGTLVPVIDLSELLTGKPAPERLSTRIILIGFPDQKGELRRAGLIAEQATRTFQKDPAAFMDSGIAITDAPYLGPVALEGKDYIQLIDPEKLLVDRAQDLLTCLPREINA
jgi:chemotaxis-related protein WspB